MALHEHLEREADRAPARTALSVSQHRLTALDVDRLANQFAWSVLERGVTPGQRVAVALPRDQQLVPAIIGVLKAGAAFVPIDPHLPEVRIRFMLDDSDAACLITDGASHPGLTNMDRPCIDVASGNSLSDACHRPSIRVESIAAAYVIYTSGTTGRPKGVVVEHGNVDNLVHGWRDLIPFAAGSTMGSITTVGFDIFLAETLVPMTYGLQIALAGEDDVATPAAVGKWLVREHVDVLQVTPSRLSWLLADGTSSRHLADVKVLVIGGEALAPSLMERVRMLTDAQMFNVYGPTEATVWTSAKKLTPGEPISIGKPIAGVQYGLHSRTDGQAADDQSGELLIGGTAVARGYLGDPARTLDRFYEADGKRWYRTGDAARRLPSGEIQIIGRIDHQIKIDGYRVELGEVETVLSAFPGVREAVVVPLDVEHGGRTLAAVVTSAAPGTTVDVDAVWASAAECLPRYMMPSTIVAVPAVPLNPAGKTDRVAIERLLREQMRQHLDAAPRDPLDFLCTTVARWTNGPVDPVHGGLLELGVGSLNTARLTVEIAYRYGVHLDLTEITAIPSLQRLAELIQRNLK